MFRDDFRFEPAAWAAHVALIDQVFGIESEARGARFGWDASTRPFAFFDGQGRCVAALEAFILPLMINGKDTKAAALRAVAVHPDLRGRGLFRDLMDRALSWCDRIGPTLLYSETEALYERFGFRLVPQHKHVGPPPRHQTSAPAARRLSLAVDTDLALVQRLLAIRTPVSNHVAARASGPVVLVQMASNDDLALHYLADQDALIVSDKDGGTDTFILADVVAATIPSLSHILASLGRRPLRVEVLFPPDQLDWSASPARDDTGLMIRGPVPPAFARPFMLPPTAEF